MKMSATRRRRDLTLALCLGGGLFVGSFVLALPLPLLAGWALSAPVSAVAAYALMKRKFPDSPMFEESGCDDTHVVFSMGREETAETLALLNSGDVAPAEPRVMPTHALGAALAFAGALVGGAALFFLLTAVIHVDNVTDVDVAVILDGRTVASVPPGEGRAATGKVRTRRGAHSLTYSADGKPGATHALRLARDVLYVPGGNGCHRILWVEYAASKSDQAPLPKLLPNLELHPDLPDVDYWFTDVPASVEVRHGETKVLSMLLRHGDCTHMRNVGCRDAVIDAYITCRDRSTGRAAIDQCVAQAKAGCANL